MTTSSPFDPSRSWHGTADGLVRLLQRDILALALDLVAPSVRTIRLWRTRGLLSRSEGAGFAFRQVLEALGTAILLKRGWTLVAIGEVLPTLDDEALEVRILAEARGERAQWTSETLRDTDTDASPRSSSDAATDDAAILLAQGLLKLYERVLTGRHIVRQDDSLPSELHAALCLLGRLYIEEGKEDRAASVHEVCDRAREPLRAENWGLSCFQSERFRFRDAVLVDPDLRVPTTDCAAVADAGGGFGEDQVIEHRLHTTLRDAAEQLGARRRHAAYTAMRELVGRCSLTTAHHIYQFLQERSLTSLQDIVTESFYEPVPDAWLIRGAACRCQHCGTLLRPHPDMTRYPDGRCPLRACRARAPAASGERLSRADGQLLVARPQVLTYWTGPAIDELAIYDAARRLSLEVELYPESDECDVSIGGYDLGIDAKSYASPVSLALRLNRGIGGLLKYRRRVLAVSDYLVARKRDYLLTVRAMLDSDDTASLELRSVSEVIALLEEGIHA